MNAHFIGSQLYKYEFFDGRSGIGCLQRRKSYKYFIIPVLKSHRIVKQSAAGADISSWSGSDRKNGKIIRSPNNVLENVENEKEMSTTKRTGEKQTNGITSEQQSTYKNDAKNTNFLRLSNFFFLLTIQ